MRLKTLLLAGIVIPACAAQALEPARPALVGSAAGTRLAQAADPGPGGGPRGERGGPGGGTRDRGPADGPGAGARERGPAGAAPTREAPSAGGPTREGRDGGPSGRPGADRDAAPRPERSPAPAQAAPTRDEAPAARQERAAPRPEPSRTEPARPAETRPAREPDRPTAEPRRGDAPGREERSRREDDTRRGPATDPRPGDRRPGDPNSSDAPATRTAPESGARSRQETPPAGAPTRAEGERRSAPAGAGPTTPDAAPAQRSAPAPQTAPAQTAPAPTAPGATQPQTRTAPLRAEPPAAGTPPAPPSPGAPAPTGRDAGTPPQTGERDRRSGGDTRQGGDGRSGAETRPGGFLPGLAAGAVAGAAAGAGIAAVRERRREREENGRTIIQEPGRVIVRDRDRVFIRHDEAARFEELGQSRRERRGSETVTIVERPGGGQVITIVDDDGRLVRRIRRSAEGREVVIIDNSFRGPRRREIYEEVVELPPPQVRIPRERYIVEAESAPPELLYETLSAEPVEPIRERYTLDQVRYSPNLRARMRSVDLDTINFESGSWEVTQDQAPRLSALAQAINRAITQNPQEVFLIEGHTDAVGPDIDNLSLSDRRAQSVAELLTRVYRVPPENLTTQGYGEQYLKVNTQEASRENRRVTMRRITPLLQGQAQR